MLLEILLGILGFIFFDRLIHLNLLICMLIFFYWNKWLFLKWNIFFDFSLSPQALLLLKYFLFSKLPFKGLLHFTGIIRRWEVIWIEFLRTLLIGATILTNYFVDHIFPLVQANFISLLIITYIILISVTKVGPVLTAIFLLLRLTFQSILLFEEHL